MRPDSRWQQWLAQQAVRRDDAGLRRSLVPRGRADGFVDLAGNDYLGLARDPVVVAAAADAARTWGAGAGASQARRPRAAGCGCGLRALEREPGRRRRGLTRHDHIVAGARSGSSRGFASARGLNRLGALPSASDPPGCDLGTEIEASRWLPCALS